MIDKKRKEPGDVHPLRVLLEKGIPSYCTANELALEQILIHARLQNKPVLIEATANQVNQFGGYTGMKPVDFYNKIYRMAEEIGVAKELIILGGDHLGPLTWQNEPEEEAMKKAEELVKEYVLAGFTKIHLDTSMKLADDSADEILKTEVIARRGVRLYKKCMEAYEELLQKDSRAVRPVFVIGSEVPIPGGAQEAEETLAVTKPEAFVDTIDTYSKVFRDEGVADGWNDVIAVVVQPGVEFGDDQIFAYDRAAAKLLCDQLKQYPGIVFEGHSTDYQTADCLRQMVEDGIAILKVGPALTYGLREALFSLSMMERELVPTAEQAFLIETLEEEMLGKQDWWKKHYHGDYRQVGLSRKYSFSDRARYYFSEARIQEAIEKLFLNLRKYPIPMNMLHQYMPKQYEKVRSGKLQPEPKALALDGVAQIMADYEQAVG